jgi:hypothetical protein
MSDEAVAEKVNGQDTDSVSATNGTQEESLDSILSEWDMEEEATSKQPSKSKTEDAGDDDEIRQWVKEQREREASKAFNETMNGAVKTMREAVKDDIQHDLSDRAWRGVIHDAAEHDPRVRQAFINRHKNPSAFNKVLRALAKEEAKSQVSKSETETRDNVSAAMRAGRKQPPVNDADADADYRRKVKGMTPAEREAEKRRILRG